MEFKAECSHRGIKNWWYFVNFTLTDFKEKSPGHRIWYMMLNHQAKDFHKLDGFSNLQYSLMPLSKFCKPNMLLGQWSDNIIKLEKWVHVHLRNILTRFESNIPFSYSCTQILKQRLRHCKRHCQAMNFLDVFSIQ